MRPFTTFRGETGQLTPSRKGWNSRSAFSWASASSSIMATLSGRSACSLGRAGLPVVHQHHRGPGLEVLGQARVQVLAQVHRGAGQGLVQERVLARAHPPGPLVPGDGDAGRAAQGAPLLLQHQGAGHVAEAQAEIGVDAKDQ